MTVRPSIIEAAKSVRWCSVIGATVPCCDSATAASDVILAFGVAALTTKTSGLPARSHRSTGAHGAQVMRAGASRDDNQFGDRDHRLDRHGDRGRGIDHRQLEPLLSQDRQIGGQPCNGGLGEGGIFVGALVPPIGKRSLRVDVDQDDRTRTGALRLNGHMSREGGLARSALLRCQCQYTQDLVPLGCACNLLTVLLQSSAAILSWRSQTTPNFGLTGWRFDMGPRPQNRHNTLLTVDLL